jgi:hypothetical protein
MMKQFGAEKRQAAFFLAKLRSRPMRLFAVHQADLVAIQAEPLP